MNAVPEEKPQTAATPGTPENPALPDDKFRKGRIVKYFPQSSYGFVRDEHGKEIYFHLDELRFMGTKKDRRFVYEGAPVGVDVSRTSRGLRIVKMKLY